MKIQNPKAVNGGQCRAGWKESPEKNTRLDQESIVELFKAVIKEEFQ